MISPAYLTPVTARSRRPRSPWVTTTTGPVYRFSFQVNNLSDREQVYTLDGVALTDQVNLDYPGYTFMGETSRALGASVVFSAENGQLPKLYDVNGDGAVDMTDVQVLLDGVNGLEKLSETVRQDFDLNGDGILTRQMCRSSLRRSLPALPPWVVRACQRHGRYSTVTLTDADKAYMDEYYEKWHLRGRGFVRLYAQSEDRGGPEPSLHGDSTATGAIPRSLTLAGTMRARMCCATGIPMCFLPTMVPAIPIWD